MHMHGPHFPELVSELVNEGKLSAERVNYACSKILEAKFKLGLFENRYVDEDNKKSEIHGNQKLFKNQILIFKLNPEDLVDFQQRFGLKLFNQKELYLLGNLGAIEAIITPGSRLIGRKYDYFKRLIGECYKRKINLNAWLVSNGHAVAFRKYSKKYVSEEILAKQEKKGMWQGKFEMPWDYRKSKKN